MVVPYKEKETGKREQVAEMFDNISPKYDLLNHLLSGGIDVWWRKKAISMLRSAQPKVILDIATGTGDLAVEAVKQLKPEKVIGVDISEGMLAMGREKMKKIGMENVIELRSGDSEKLLFDNNTFDAVIVSFGVRNFENLEKGLTDMHRVTKPGGICLIVEFSKPKTPIIKQLYWLYNSTILPLIGKIISKDKAAYSYLPESVKAFPEGNDFLQVFEKVGFRETKSVPLTFGICTVYIGKKKA